MSVKKIIIILIILNIFVLGVLIYIYTSQNHATPIKKQNSKFQTILTNNSTIAPTPIPTLRPVPVSIGISSLGIMANIEAVGVTKSGNMDVPKNAADVAWFEYGPIPGDLGNSVITGHYDTPTGRAAVFYDLKKIKIGDIVEVFFNNSTSRKFKVTEKTEVPFTNSTDQYTEHIFVSRPGINLNLITCDGVWNPAKHTYSTRLVVYTSLLDVK